MKNQILLTVFAIFISLNVFATTDLYKCEQVYSEVDNGLTVRVFVDEVEGLTKLELRRVSSGRADIKIYAVEKEQYDNGAPGGPIMYKGSALLLKISMAPAPGEDGKKLGTLITYDDGGPDSESLKCEILH